MQSETLLLVPGKPDFFAPVADLSTVQLRQIGRDAAQVDGLLLRKSHAAAEAMSSRWMHVTDATPAGAKQTSVEAFEVAAPIDEPLHFAEDRAGATEAPRVGVDDMPVAALCFDPPLPPVAVVQIKIGDNELREEPEHPNDAVRDAASISVRKGRGTSLTPLQLAIIVFGCIALLASGVFINSDAPSQRAGVAVQQPEAVASGAQRISAAVADLLARGDERLRSGDVFASRLFYEKAADAGNAHGALMMGATFDPTFLASIGVYGLRGDESAALAWYRRAGDLGDPEAAKLAKNPRPK